MDNENKNQATSAVELTKDSPSDEVRAFELLVMRQKLHAAGKATATMTCEQLESAYRALIEAEQLAATEADERRANETAELMRKSVLQTMRNGLIRLAIDPANMSESEMTERLEAETAKAITVRAERERQRQRDGRRRRAESLFKESACPPLHVANLDKIDIGQNQRWTQTLNLLVEQAGYAGGYIVALLGVSGTGKTQLTASVIHRCCESLMTCRYTTAGALFRSIRATYTQVAKGERGTSEDEIIAKWSGYDLLVIDEIADRLESRAEQIVLANLLDERYRRQLCTVLIGNLDRDAFAASVGDSIVSRIRETGEVIECDEKHGWIVYRPAKTSTAWRKSDGAAKRVPSGEPNPRRIEE
jgi:DNA replication protein DnaC